jgi:hypothetical protein
VRTLGDGIAVAVLDATPEEDFSRGNEPADVKKRPCDDRRAVAPERDRPTPSQSLRTFAINHAPRAPAVMDSGRRSPPTACNTLDEQENAAIPAVKDEPVL